MPRVAIEDTLQQVKEYLQNKGYDVVKLEENGQYDAIVISGQDKNVMGMQDITTKASVIDASGLTPEEVYLQLQNTPL